MDSIVVDLVPIRSLSYPVQEEDVLFVISSTVEENNDLPSSIVLVRNIVAEYEGAGGMVVGGELKDLSTTASLNGGAKVRSLEDYSKIVDTVLFVSGDQGIALETPPPATGTGPSFYWG